MGQKERLATRCECRGKVVLALGSIEYGPLKTLNVETPDGNGGGRYSRPSRRTCGTTVAPHLESECQGDDRTATSGRVLIVDGYYRKDIELDSTELRNGHIVYSPVTGGVSCQLEISTVCGIEASAEPVRMVAVGAPAYGFLGDPLAPRTYGGEEPRIPMITDALRPGARDTEGATDSEQEEIEQRSGPEASANPVAGLAPRLPSTFAENAQPVPPGLREPMIVARRTLVDLPMPNPPNISQDMKSGFSSSAPAVLEQMLLPSHSTPEMSDVPAVQKPASKKRVFIAPVLLRRVTPDYPPLAREARVSGTVQVEATIDKEGRPISTRAFSGPMMLRIAAGDAVMGFRYKPATLNGEPMQSTTVVDIVFHLSR